MCPLGFPLPSTQLMANPQYLFVTRKNNLYAPILSAEKGRQPVPIPAQLRPPPHTHTCTHSPFGNAIASLPWAKSETRGAF